MFRRATDLPVWPAPVRFSLAPFVTEWQGLSLTRILAAVFAALPFVRPMGINDVLAMFVILGACVAKDNFTNFERIGRLLPRFGRRDSDPVRAAALETAERADETNDAAKAVVVAVEKVEKAEQSTGQRPGGE